MSVPKQLEVLIAGEHAGQLRMSTNGELSFVYSPGYSGPHLSINMPYSTDEYSGRRVSTWFDNLLPDNPQVRKGMAEEAGTSMGVFPLLTHFGFDLPGAVQVVAPDSMDLLNDREQSYLQITRASIGERLRELEKSEAQNRIRSWAASEEHWSLGGMQAKIALRRFEGLWYECTGASASNVIVKPGACGLENQALVEFATMRLAKKCGIPCAKTSIESFDGTEAIIVDRYDRFISPGSGSVIRIHQEDLCQAMAIAPSKKYAADGGPSSLQIMSLLEQAEGNSRRRFADALLYNYLTASTDAHAKNYSLLHPGPGRSMLAPLYDVASAAPFMKKGKPYHLAMSIGGENRVGWLRRSSLQRFAETHALDLGALIERTDELAETIVQNLDAALDDLPKREGIDRISELMRVRITALCRSAQRNIRVNTAHFKPVDITRFHG